MSNDSGYGNLATSVGRFKILYDNQIKLPGKCACCGTSRGTFVDWGTQIDWYGSVYLCLENCFREACNIFGFLNPAQADKLHEQTSKLLEDNFKLIHENGELKNAVASLNELLNSDSDLNRDYSSGSETESKKLPDPSGPVEKTKRRVDEQTNEQGSTSVQYNDSVEKLIGNFDI